MPKSHYKTLHTPWKINMEPKNWLFDIVCRCFSFSKGSFSGSMVVFWGVLQMIELIIAPRCSNSSASTGNSWGACLAAWTPQWQPWRFITGKFMDSLAALPKKIHQKNHGSNTERNEASKGSTVWGENFSLQWTLDRFLWQSGSH